MKLSEFIVNCEELLAKLGDADVQIVLRDGEDYIPAGGPPRIIHSRLYGAPAAYQIQNDYKLV